ncbi:MAG: radical SAM protein [Candidatus Latescibacterota bacterium]
MRSDSAEVGPPSRRQPGTLGGSHGGPAAVGPAYARLLASGELARRATQAAELLAPCRLCPRACGADRRRDQEGFCRTGRRARLASFGPHLGEEGCLRGRRGSGTLFFSGCNLSCVFCQNHPISQGDEGTEVEPEELAEAMLELQARGCHNLNLVSPSHVVPQWLEALALAARRGLELPLVYNTNAFDSLDVLRLVDGVVDVYMPDFKCWDEERARTYLGAADYPRAARAALAEMHRQVGDLLVDRDGLARRGVLVRHLVMPGAGEDTRVILRFLAGLSADTYVNLMAQYRPANRVCAARHPELNRRPRLDEVAAAYRAAEEAGLHRFDEPGP